MTKENKYIRVRIQENTMKNLGIALTALSEVWTDELYYNAELANACHELRMKITPLIHECHEEQNRFKSILDD
tara:strand:- start:4732 stop:4950 length:219 start_codon:yes stop_codon:yes gene_type:complete